MKTGVKIALAATAGISVIVALKNLSDEIKESEEKTQLALKATESKMQSMQALNTATPATSDDFVILPFSPLKWQNLSGGTGDNLENRQRLLAWILANVPQECVFTGLYKPNLTMVIRGYKYATDTDLTKCYIGVMAWSTFSPGVIKTFGIKKGEYFENQIGG